MPLAPGSDRATISRNISELTHHGSRPRSHEQIVAIALANADRHPHKDAGGAIPPKEYIEPPADKNRKGGETPSVPGTHDRPDFSNPNDLAPAVPPNRQDEREQGSKAGGHVGLAFGGSMSHGDPLGGLAKPHAVSLGKIAPLAPPKAAMTNIPHPWFERQEARSMGKGFAEGGHVGLASGGGVYPDMPFDGGLIGGSGGGRTDRLPLSVPNDSHVVTADVMSGMGQGHTAFGGRLLTQALRIGPYGVPVPTEIHGHGAPHAPAAPSQHALGESHGGRAQDHGGRVGILAASGEFVIPAEDWVAKDDIDGEHYLHRGVRSLGRDECAKNGKSNPSDEQIMRAGHDVVDRMIKNTRDFVIAWLKRAPKPKKADGGAVGLAAAA